MTVDNRRQTDNLESRHDQSDCQSESDTGQLLQFFFILIQSIKNVEVSLLFEGISVRWKKLSISSVPADGFCHQQRSNWPPGSCGGQGNRVWPKKLQKSKKWKQTIGFKKVPKATEKCSYENISQRSMQCFHKGCHRPLDACLDWLVKCVFRFLSACVLVSF